MSTAIQQQQQQQQQRQHSPATLPPPSTNIPPSSDTASLIQKLAIANEQAWFNSGNLAELMGDAELSMKSYEAALRHNPYSVQVLTQIAALCRFKEQFPRAVEYFHQILKIENTNGEIWGALGHCYLMMDELQQAYSAYQQALYHLPNPKEPKLWYGIGILYDRYGSLEHAEEAFSAVMRMDPKFEKANEIYFRLGIIYKQQGKHDLSLQCFHYILHSPPRPLTEVDIWFQIGHVHEQQKEYTSAKEAYERVLTQNPSHAKVLQQLGWLYHQSAASFCNEETACQFLTRSLGVDPSDAQSWYLLGRCYMAQQEHNKAYEAYQQAVYRDGRNPTFWCSIGVLYYQINQYRDALDAYSRAIRLNPYIAEVWYDLGTLYESCNNQKADAIDAYQRAEHLDPTNPHIKQRLHLLRTHGSSLGGMTSAPQDLHPAIQPSSPTPFNMAPAGQSRLGMPSQVQAGLESAGYPRNQPMSMDGRQELRAAPEMQQQEMRRSIQNAPMHVARDQNAQALEPGHGLPSISRRSTSPYPPWPQAQHQQASAPYGVGMDRIPDIASGNESGGRPTSGGNRSSLMGSKGAQADRLLSVPGPNIHPSSSHLHGLQQDQHKPEGTLNNRDAPSSTSVPSSGHPSQLYQDQHQQQQQHAHTQHAQPQHQNQLPVHSPPTHSAPQKHHPHDYSSQHQDTETADGELRQRPHSSPTQSPVINSFPQMALNNTPGPTRTNQPYGYPPQQQQYARLAHLQQPETHPHQGQDSARGKTPSNTFGGSFPLEQQEFSRPTGRPMAEDGMRLKRDDMQEANVKDANADQLSKDSPSPPHHALQQREQKVEQFGEATRPARLSMDTRNLTENVVDRPDVPTNNNPASTSGPLSRSATSSPLEQPDNSASAMRLSRPIDEDYDDDNDDDTDLKDDKEKSRKYVPVLKLENVDASVPSATAFTALTEKSPNPRETATSNPELKRGPPSPHGVYHAEGTVGDSVEGRKKARNRSSSLESETVKVQKVDGELWNISGNTERKHDDKGNPQLDEQREEGEVEEEEDENGGEYDEDKDEESGQYGRHRYERSEEGEESEDAEEEEEEVVVVESEGEILRPTAHFQSASSGYPPVKSETGFGSTISVGVPLADDGSLESKSGLMQNHGKGDDRPGS